MGKELTVSRIDEVLRALSDAADEINGSIDRQTYSEKRKLRDWPDDHEFCVAVTAGQERALNDAICAAQKALRERSADDERPAPTLSYAAALVIRSFVLRYGEHIVSTPGGTPISAADIAERLERDAARA